MRHVNQEQTKEIVKSFPKVPRSLVKALTEAYVSVESSYKSVQERLVVKHLSDKHLNLYTELRESIECPFTLFIHLCLGRPIGVCTCGGVTSFRAATRKFQEFCGVTCANEYVKEARKETWLRKYGADNPCKNAAVRSKISKSVKSTNARLGRTSKSTRRRRNFTYQPVLPSEAYTDTSDRFYVYVLLDPRKPGPFTYGKWKFDYEPFYVGKGKGGRAYDHLKDENMNRGARSNASGNNFKKSKIRKIIKETGDYPIVCIKRKGLYESDAHELESKLIWLIGRKDEGFGPLTNLTNGGEGVVGRKWTKKQRLAQSVRNSAYTASLTKEQRSATYRSR